MSSYQGRMISRLAILCSGLVAVLAAPFLLLAARGRERWFERWGLWKWRTSSQSYLWLHGASAGEVVGLSSLIPKLKGVFRDEILLTTTSVTGLQVVGDEVKEQHLLPLDLSACLRRAIGERNIRAFICAETEIWPALYSWLLDQEIPIFLVNGRISDRSFPRYLKSRFLIRHILKRIAFVATGDPSSVDRFASLGVKPDRIEFMGNSKYSRQPSVTSDEQRQDLRKILDISESLPTVVLGSLRPGEEKFLFPSLVNKDFAGKVQFIIAPRHAERYEYFADQLKGLGVEFKRFSSKDSSKASVKHVPVLLLDSFGWLEKAYALADLVFIGGSLEPHGGHNPLEACAYGAPVLMGPHYGNVLHVVRELAEKRGIGIINSSYEFEQALAALLVNDIELLEMGTRGASFFKEHSLAADRIVTKIKEILAVSTG